MNMNIDMFRSLAEQMRLLPEPKSTIYDVINDEDGVRVVDEDGNLVDSEELARDFPGDFMSKCIQDLDVVNCLKKYAQENEIRVEVGTE